MKLTLLRLKAVLALSGVSVLAIGCANVQDAYKTYKNDKELTYVDEAKLSCTRYGFKVDTDVFAQCVNANTNAAKDRAALVEAAFHSKKN